MDYNKLKTLCLIEEYGSLTEVGRQLRRSQSAISQQIASLEDELDLHLLVRKNGKTVLSKEALDLVSVAAPSLQKIDSLFSEMKSDRQTVRGHIVIGALQDDGTEYSLGDIIASFSQLHPQVTIEVVGGNAETIEENILNGKFDIGFSVVFKNKDLLRRHGIKTSWHSLYASTKYLKSVKPIKTYKQLLEAQLIDLTDEFLAIKTFLQRNSPKLASSLTHRKPDITAANIRTIKEIVSGGAGIAMLPDFLVADELKRGSIQKVFPKSKSLFGTMDIVYFRNRSLRLCESEFIKEARSFYSDD